MSRCIAASVVVVLILSLAPAAPVPKHLMPKETPFALPTREGTTWQYDGNESSLVITKVEDKDGGKLVTTEWVDPDGKRRPHMVQLISSKGIFLVAETGSSYDEPWCIFKLPHKEGQSWETKARRGGSDCATGTMTSGPIEKIKVPAGEITAARVEWKFNGGSSTYWYAEGIGLVQQDGHMRLKSFTPAK